MRINPNQINKWEYVPGFQKIPANKRKLIDL